jgi:MFS family permease
MTAEPRTGDVTADVSPQTLRTVIIASSAGTVFEWYDFFIYGALATIVSKHFFANLPDSQAFVFTLLTFAVGFVVRPLGALVFGRMGDQKGRKGAFLITITLMGLATFAIGCLPDFDQIGIAAPILLVACRVLQGLALGGEYGGAAIYVAEHSPPNRRGFTTSWIQTSAALGLLGALGVILLTRTLLGEEAFRSWGWRVPFWVSLGLLGLSLWIRMKLGESPAFQKMKDEGRTSKAPFKETFGHWPTVRLMLLVLFTLMMAQGVVWYTGNFYTQFFLERLLKVPPVTVNLIMIAVTIVSAVLYMFFGWLSDKIGRKPVMLFGMALMLCAYFPGFHMLTQAANPALAQATERAPVVVVADPADCTFQLDLTGGAHQFTTACDIAKGVLASAGVSYDNVAAPTGTGAAIQIGETRLLAPSAVGRAAGEVREIRKTFEDQVKAALVSAGYPAGADAERINLLAIFGIMVVFIVAATALYGPLAACLVELFPTRVRYTALSFPYHIGTGWFGGLQPAISFAIVAATGNIFAGLWYPAIVTAIAVVLSLLLLPETRTRDIHA